MHLRVRSRSVLAFAVAACFGYAHADTFIETRSQPGDEMGGGVDRHLDPSGGVMIVGASSRGMQVRWTSHTQPATDRWQFDFSPASGGTLAEGNYVAFPDYYGPADWPGIWILSPDGFVRATYGPFTIYEMTVAADGSTVTSFSADFELRSSHSAGYREWPHLPATGWLRGGIRYNSSIPYPGPWPTPTPSTFIEAKSEPGDFFGGGVDRHLDSTAGVMIVSATSRGAQVRWVSQANPATDHWEFDFNSGTNRVLAVDGYYAFLDSAGCVGCASAAIDAQGRTARASGPFTIYEIALAADGSTVTSFAADFEQRAHYSDPALHGGIRYNSSFPYPGPPPTPTPTPTPTPLPTPTPPWPPKAPTPTPITSARGTSPSGGSVGLAMSSANASCTLGTVNFLAGPPMAAPADVAYPHGVVSFRSDYCGIGQTVTFTIEFPGPLPPTAQWWKYGATPDNYDNRWVPIPATVDGNRLTFTLTDGARGDDDLVKNGSISHLGMLVIPGGMYQDLWWGGSPENGWGMSLVQHADKLFANLYVYDANGSPVWYVMPSGGWNPQHNAFSGPLYLPKGSPFYAYDATKFDAGASVGTMSLTFADANNALLEYRINGVSGSKSIHRVLFGPASPPTDQPHADLWWAGSAQNGWGLAVLQQNSTLFGLWFTYDANGKPTWFVMPGGDWVVTDLWRGAIFKGTGSPWVGAAYDASKLHLNEVGTFDLRFSGSNAATFTYSAEGKSGTIPLSRIPF